MLNYKRIPGSCKNCHRNNQRVVLQEASPSTSRESSDPAEEQPRPTSAQSPLLAATADAPDIDAFAPMEDDFNVSLPPNVFRKRVRNCSRSDSSTRQWTLDHIWENYTFHNCHRDKCHLCKMKILSLI